MCDCIKTMDEKLARHNGKLGLTISFPLGAGKSRAYPTIEVEKINKRGKKPPIALPSYCPFCGVAYAATEDSSNDGE